MLQTAYRLKLPKRQARILGYIVWFQQKLWDFVINFDRHDATAGILLSNNVSTVRNIMTNIGKIANGPLFCKFLYVYFLKSVFNIKPINGDH